MISFNTHIRLYGVILCVLLGTAFLGGRAMAQEAVQLRGFEILPSLGLRTSYVSNIFAEDVNEDDDFVVAIEPRLAIRKAVRDHTFTLEGGADILRYRDNTSENIVNWGGRFHGELTATKRLKLPFMLSYDVDHLQRNLERTQSTSRAPIQRARGLVEAGAVYGLNRLSLDTTLRYSQQRYDNGRTVAGDVLVRNDGDNNAYGFDTRIKYKGKSNFKPFIGVQIEREDFLRTTDAVARDNVSISGGLGVEYNYHDLLRVEVAVGQGRLNYDDASLEDIDAFIVEGNVEWTPRVETVLSASLSRETEEDNVINLGLVTTKAALGLVHQLDEDLFFDAGFRVEEDDFDVSVRKDKIFQGSASLRYILNPRYQIEGAYSYSLRNSNDDSFDFDQNVFMLYLNSSL